MIYEAFERESDVKIYWRYTRKYSESHAHDDDCGGMIDEIKID